LPLKLKKKVEARAEEYDMTLAGYLRYLAISDLRAGDVPVFEPSEETIRAFKEAKKEEREGKLKQISNISDFFAKMSK
jgi:hypothetical protein